MTECLEGFMHRTQHLWCVDSAKSALASVRAPCALLLFVAAEDASQVDPLSSNAPVGATHLVLISHLALLGQSHIAALLCLLSLIFYITS